MDEIEEELEALEALYPEGLRVTRAGTASSGGSTQAQHTTVALDVTPRTLDDETRQYARVTLRIVLDNDYPTGAPSLALTDAKGLDDTRQATVMGRLRDAADECIGDPVLALLCETAFETLTELNHPDGDCAFCLTPVCPDPSVVQEGAETFMKLGKCFHCFHTSCFTEWWRWRIRAAEEEASPGDPRTPSAARRPRGGRFTPARCVAPSSTTKTRGGSPRRPIPRRPIRRQPAATTTTR